MEISTWQWKGELLPRAGLEGLLRASTWISAECAGTRFSASTNMPLRRVLECGHPKVACKGCSAQSLYATNVLDMKANVWNDRYRFADTETVCGITSYPRDPLMCQPTTTQ